MVDYFFGTLRGLMDPADPLSDTITNHPPSEGPAHPHGKFVAHTDLAHPPRLKFFWTNESPAPGSRKRRN
jgi:hypothetical protein